jgi:hypothetical protein
LLQVEVDVWIGWGTMKYFDINALIYYLSSPPHTVRPTGTSSYASLSCKNEYPTCLYCI